MCTKYWDNGSRHNKYFSPYESPYDSYINFMNVLDNVQISASGAERGAGQAATARSQRIVMKRNELFLILIALASFAGAQSAAFAEEEEHPPNIMRSKDGRIQIGIAIQLHWKKSPSKSTIHIQAVDEAKSSTVIVISENQSRFDGLEQYSRIVREKMCQNLRDPQADRGEKIEVAGHSAVRFEITGISSNGLRMGFLLTIIQTETRFNQVIGCCLRTRFADRKDEFVKIAANLKELPGKKVAEGK